MPCTGSIGDTTRLVARHGDARRHSTVGGLHSVERSRRSVSATQAGEHDPRLKAPWKAEGRSPVGSDLRRGALFRGHHRNVALPRGYRGSGRPVGRERSLWQAGGWAREAFRGGRPRVSLARAPQLRAERPYEHELS